MGDRIAVMKEGRLEQIGTPDEIYNRPTTLFVAGFVGSPPMNLIEGEVATQDGCARFSSGDFAVEPNRAAGAAGPATLGVRPQHLRIHAGPADGAIPVTVFAVEHLGRVSVVILEDGDRNKLHALVEPGSRAGSATGSMQRPIPHTACCSIRQDAPCPTPSQSRAERPDRRAVCGPGRRPGRRDRAARVCA